MTVPKKLQNRKGTQQKLQLHLAWETHTLQQYHILQTHLSMIDYNYKEFRDSKILKRLRKAFLQLGRP